jgi:hypothetical protein
MQLNEEHQFSGHTLSRYKTRQFLQISGFPEWEMCRMYVNSSCLCYLPNVYAKKY